MKYDYTKKPTQGTKRTLKSFSNTLFDLLKTKKFEKISVNEICEHSSYPRATFYNYFYDKNDLLDYCWSIIASELNISEFFLKQSEETIYIVFERLYIFLTSIKEELDKVLEYNKINSPLISSFKNYLSNLTQESVYSFFNTEDIPIPLELVSDYYSNNIILVIEWIFLKKHKTSLEEGIYILNFLLTHNSD